MEIKNITEDNSNWKGHADFIDQWFLMSSPYPLLAIMTTYLVFVLKLGPDFMKKRQPLDLGNVILLYNAIQVIYSAYLVAIGGSLLLRHGLLSTECIRDNINFLFPVASSTYYYFFAKITELLDTVFFVLRKKNHQVSFLHVYHHSIIVLTCWCTLKYEPSYSCIFLGTLNSFVHVIMYGYYGLSTFPQLTPYLWWKKYITKMQLAQFMLVIVQVTAYNYYTGCPSSNILFATILFNLVLMIVLFSDFYIKAYSKNKKDNKNKLIDKTEKDKNANTALFKNSDSSDRLLKVE